MSLQYSEVFSQDIFHEFDKLMTLEAQNLVGAHPIIKSNRLQKKSNLSSFEDAKAVLSQLITNIREQTPRKNWKTIETSYLLFIVDKYCFLHDLKCEQLELLDWMAISKLVPGREWLVCQYRYLQLTAASVLHVPWTSDESQILLRIIQNQKQGVINWKTISEKLYEHNYKKIFRTGKQCRQHYSCFLRPDLKKGLWSEEQDYKLVNLYLILGGKWCRIAKFINGRNENAVKNRFFLLFQNKHNNILAKSDLLKLAHRHKQRLQKKLSIQKLNLIRQQVQIDLQISKSSQNQTQSNQNYLNMPKQNYRDHSNIKQNHEKCILEEIERYIDL